MSRYHQGHLASKDITHNSYEFLGYINHCPWSYTGCKNDLLLKTLASYCFTYFIELPLKVFVLKKFDYKYFFNRLVKNVIMQNIGLLFVKQFNQFIHGHYSSGTFLSKLTDFFNTGQGFQKGLFESI